jgi:hypothetical protein
MENFTSTPCPIVNDTLIVNDTGHDVDATMTWAFLLAVCLGVLWAVFDPMNLRCCTTEQDKDEPVRDLEEGSKDPPIKDQHDSKGCVPAAPDDVPEASGEQKLYFIDNLKTCLTLMVINTNAFQLFLGGGAAPFEVDSVPSHFRTFMSCLGNINSAYTVALFFMLTGFTMPSGLDRLGPCMFIKDNMKRLGLPAIVCFFGLGPVTLFLIDSDFGLGGAYHRSPVLGTEWFAFWLLAFSIMYAFVAQYGSCPSWVKLPGTCGLLALGLGIGLVQFVFSTYFNQWGDESLFLLNPFFDQTPYFVAFFAAGIVAQRNGWLDQLASFSSCSLWALRLLSVTFAGLIFLILQWHDWLAASSTQDTSVEQKNSFWLMLCSWAVVQCVFGVVVTVVELDLFRRCFNHGGGSIHRFFTDAGYGVYLCHLPFVQFFGWTYVHFVLEVGLGKELAFEADRSCFLRFKCPKDVGILQISMTTPIEERHLWIGWAYTVVLTALVVFPLIHFLKKLPVLRSIL